MVMGLKERWDVLLKYRSQVQSALENARRMKIIGSSLEAVVELEADATEYEFLKRYEHDLATLFIVSEVKLSKKVL
jgi:isoleucyl-tRNA synthetase